MTDQANAEARVDRLLDAIELAKEGRRDEALPLLRELIREDDNFEEAWLWMSVVVDSLEKSTICLDNALRVNPNNVRAAGALFRLRESEIRMENRRARLRFYRDISFASMWLLFVLLLYAVLLTYADAVPSP
jgi:tetratricopeptide (TPR) repeat protein